MLGKRFRRTTSMSHLGPGSPVGTPVAEAMPEKIQTPHKAARPSIFQTHIAEHDAVERRRADACSGDVNMGRASAPQKQRPWLMNEGSCAVDVVYCNDLNMEVMGAGCEDSQGSSIEWDGGESASASAKAYSDTMLEWSHEMVQAEHGGVMSSFQEQTSGSLMAYQMGLWIQNSMHVSQGNNGKLEKLEEAILPVDFLDVCFYCKRRLRHERDIFIYRGDTAFCSEECRHRQIVNDERRSSRATNNNNKRGAAGRASSSSETAVAA